ncbi:MAG: NUDIX hydrolase [Kiritimatiellae bacterium]|nr:NUDIX hydrolase [Kiritimatiellia bacterium]MDW8458915.1 NUDIX hydrolase [Verrucomicrobiota bacterium]
MHEKTLSRNTAFAGRLVRVETLDVELEDGRRAYRELVRHPGAICVWLRAPDGRWAFVRQFRCGAQKEMLEVVAGILDPNEPPEDAARREVREETGFSLKRLVRLGVLYPTPGYVEERIVCFYGEADAAGPRDLDHDERLVLELLTDEEFRARVRNGQIEDAKTLAAWALYRECIADPRAP